MCSDFSTSRCDMLLFYFKVKQQATLTIDITYIIPITSQERGNNSGYLLLKWKFWLKTQPMVNAEKVFDKTFIFKFNFRFQNFRSIDDSDRLVKTFLNKLNKFN